MKLTVTVFLCVLWPAAGFLLSASAADNSAAITAQMTALRSSNDAARAAALKNLQHYAGGIKPMVQALAGALSDKSPEMRSGASRALAEIGPSARDASPALILLLNDSDETVRVSAALALGEIGASSQAVFCPLVFLLQDASASVRAHAAEALGKMGPAAAATAPFLRELLTDSTTETAVNAAMALAAMGEPAPEAARLYILALSRSGDSRKQAEAALRSIGPAAIFALKTALLEKNKELASSRLEAAAMLERLGEGARPALPALIEALGDKDVEVQNSAAQTLLKLDAAPLEASRALIRLMRESSEMRARVLVAFEKMNEHAAEIPLAMIKADKDPGTRRESARVLARLAPRFRQNPEVLAAGLNDSDETVRYSLLEALAKCGAPNSVLLGPLKAALNDRSHEVQVLACRTLGGMRGEAEAIRVLAETRLRGGNPTLRSEAGKAVLAAGADALPALPLLREALKSEDSYTRDWGVQVIDKIGPAASDAIPELVQALIKSRGSRPEVVRTLGKMGEKGIDALLPLLKATDSNTRAYAAQALGFAGVAALPKLTAMLKDDNADAVEAAEAALERMAPESAPAIPELIRAANSKNNKIRNGAVQALGKMRAAAAPALIAEIRKPDDAARQAAQLALAATGGPSAPLINEALRAEQDAVVVRSLLETLARIGPAAADSVPVILDMINRPYAGKERGRVWSSCASALGGIGASRETAVAVLFNMLASDNRDAQSDASAALRRLGTETLRVPPLTDALRNAPASWVGSALKPFGRAGMSQLVAEMTEGNPPELRDAAARAFASLAPECVPFLLSTLDENPGVSVGILLAIGEIRIADAERRSPKSAAKAPDEMQKALESCTPALQRKIRSGSPDEVIAALWASGKAVGAGPDALAAAVKNLAASSPDVHSYGVAALNFYDVKGQSRAIVAVLPILLKASGSTNYRKPAMSVLQAAGYSAESVPGLVAAIEDADHGVRNTAAAAIKTLGVEARSGVAALISILEHGNPQAASTATTALVNIGSDSVPLLIAALRSENPKLRASALNALTSFKLAMLTPHVKLLAEAAKDEREEVGTQLLHVIAGMAQDGRPAEAQIRLLLSHDNEAIFSEAVRTLNKIGADIFGALAAQVDNPNFPNALRAVRAMQGQTAADPKAVQAFVKRTLRHDHPKVRAAAVLLLPAKDGDLAESIPIAADAFKDTNTLVRANTMRWLYDCAMLKPDAALPLLLAGLRDDGETVGGIAGRTLIALGEKSAPALPEVRKLVRDPRKEVQANAARVLVELGIQDDPLAVMIYNESTVLAKVERYHGRQENYFEEHWNEENVHYFATTYLEALGSAKKDVVGTADPDGVFNLSGYKLKVLTAQGAHAEGGKKDWRVKGVLSGGHALLAWPVQPGVAGRVAYLCGPDGSVYERAMTPDDAARIAEMAAAFDPGPEWTRIVTPEKPAQKPIPHDYFQPKVQSPDAMEF